MPSPASNSETVQAIYAAFGRGDVPAIVEHFAEDIEWEYGRPPSPVPWLAHRRGRIEAAAFFTTIQALQFQAFEVSAILEQGPLVVALVNITATVRATGRLIQEEHEVHLWHFSPQGQIIRFRHAVDTAQHERALTPSPP